MLHKVVWRLLLGFEDVEVHFLVLEKKTRGITKEKEKNRTKRKKHTHNKQHLSAKKLSRIII